MSAPVGAGAPAERDAVVTFAEGLPGFETSRRFLLVTSPALQPFTLVKGIGDDAPSFLAIDPQRIEPHFAPALSAADACRLQAQPGQPLLWLALVTADTSGAATVNLRAPLVINAAAMVGIQMIDGDTRYRFDHPLTAA